MRFYNKAIGICAEGQLERWHRLTALAGEPSTTIRVATVITEEKLDAWKRIASLQSYTWVTITPELERFCSKLNDETDDFLRLRINSFLGLPPCRRSAFVVEFDTRLQHLRRPCADFEIYDSVCENWNLFNSTRCISNYEHSKWFDSHAQLSSRLWSGYPWTRLGYTYDWMPNARSSNPLAPIGASEFLVVPSANVSAITISSLRKYCS